MRSWSWLRSGSGIKIQSVEFASRQLWKRLQELKFYEFADQVSASWIATRIKRIGNSRKSIFQEQLGYIDGGSETLVEAVAQDIRRKGLPPVQTSIAGLQIADTCYYYPEIEGSQKAFGWRSMAEHASSSVPGQRVTRVTSGLRMYDALMHRVPEGATLGSTLR